MGENGGRQLLSTGTYQRALDSKLRLLLPKPVRQSVVTGESMFATPGTEGCLELHDSNSLAELANLVMQMGGRTETGKTFGRLFYSQAESLEIDKQGRIRIPGRLANLAALENQIVIVGVGSHWELWNSTNWESYFGEHFEAFDRVHHATFDNTVAETKSEQIRAEQGGPIGEDRDPSPKLEQRKPK